MPSESQLTLGTRVWGLRHGTVETGEEGTVLETTLFNKMRLTIEIRLS